MSSRLDEMIRKFYSYPEDLVCPLDASSYLDQYRQYRRYFVGSSDPPAENLIHHLCEALLVYEWEKSIGVHTAVSARMAEKVVMQFLRKLYDSFVVKDISILQPMDLFRFRIPGYEEESAMDVWKEGDIEVNSGIGKWIFDVKNAQRNSRGVYSTFFVKRRKEDVLLFGVLSPTENELIQAHQQDCTDQLSPPICLGTTKISNLRFIQTEFQGVDNSLRLDFRRPGCDIHDFLPPWAFDYPRKFYEVRDCVIEEIRGMSDQDIMRLLNDRHNFLPMLLAAQRMPPERWMSSLPSWEQEFIRRIVQLPRLSLGFLFALLIEFFVDTHKSYCEPHRPSEWGKFLYSEHLPEKHPLGIYDPLNIILEFINALDILYVSLGRARLKFNRFDFKGPGLMRGRLANGEMRTILAYCGSCGSFPLIYGQQESCIKCGYLVCDADGCMACNELSCPATHQARLRGGHTSAHVVDVSTQLQPASVANLCTPAELRVHFTVKEVPWCNKDLKVKLFCSWTDRVQDSWVDVCEFSFTTNLDNTVSMPMVVRVPEGRITRAISQKGRDVLLQCDNLLVWRDAVNPTALQGVITLYIDLRTAYSLPEFRLEIFCTIDRLISRDVIVGSSHVLPSAAQSGSPQSDLSYLIRETLPNAVIRLDEGYYYISEKLLIDKPISITGAGIGKTLIVSECDDWAIDINAEGTVFVHGVDLRFAGRLTKGILLEQGELVVECSRVSSANCANIRCTGNSECSLYDCEISHSRGNGLLVDQKARCILLRAECKENDMCGIVVADRASLSSRESIISRNGGAGICGLGLSKLVLDNITSANNGTGIELDGHASCELLSSRVYRNRLQGISALGHSKIAVKECQVTNHNRLAVYISGKAHCEIQNTSFEKNKNYIIINTDSETKLDSITIDLSPRGKSSQVPQPRLRVR